MVIALSRFRVANGMDADVARAFRDRPRTVETAPGFRWLEVFTAHDDPAVFYLLTRWTDFDSFDRWHGGVAHRESHAFIPKGLKLDAAWTKVYRLDRVGNVTGSSLTEVVVDAPLLFDAFAASSKSVYLFELRLDATIHICNPAARAELNAGAPLDGCSILDYMPEADGAKLRTLLTKPARSTSPILLNFVGPNRAPFTLDCWLDVHADGAVLLGQPTFRREQQLQDELMAINQELAVLSRERSREVRNERFGRESAERLNRDRNAFLTVLAHELRQPIGGALAALSVLRKMNPDPDLERPRAMLERQLRQITRLVEDLSDTARVAGGDVELRRAQVDLTRQLRDLSTAWDATAHEQHKTFSPVLPDAAVVVWGDAERLQQVFSNLVGNAFKYTPPAGTVILTLTTEPGFAIVTVQDEGEGIPAERLPRIFELFQRATKTGSGLGVGLAVVRALVEAHGGTISASSPGLGQGAVFRVRLPLANRV